MELHTLCNISDLLSHYSIYKNIYYLSLFGVSSFAKEINALGDLQTQRE